MHNIYLNLTITTIPGVGLIRCVCHPPTIFFFFSLEFSLIYEWIFIINRKEVNMNGKKGACFEFV